MPDNFKNLLERYKNHTATPEETAQVETELEKFELINDYLCETLEKDESIPNLSLPDSAADVPEQFTKMVKQSIHRAFWKLGCCVLMAVLAVTLFIQCGLSPIMDAFYYDPKKIVGEFTNQMSLDMAVYTDIRIPLGKRDSVNAVPLGYGRYNVTFPTSVYFSYIERPATVAGELSRNKLTLYDADAFRKPSVNIFARYDSQWVTTPDYALELIKGLEENQYYTAWLSFEEDISYTEFLEFEEKADIFYSWIPIRTDDSSYFPNGHMGLSSPFSGACLEGWDDEKYPYLFLSGSTADVDIDTQLAAEKDEAIITRYFLSRLRYLADSEQETFLSFFNERSRTFSSAYDYVAEHGLSIYGCVFYGTKEQLLEISGMENVYGIYVQR